METFTVKKNGYYLMVYSIWFGSLMIVLSIISLILDSGSKFKILDNDSLFGILVLCFNVFFWFYIIIHRHTRKNVEKKIKDLIESKNKNSLYILKGDKTKDRLYYDNLSQKICKILSYKKNFAVLLIFSKNEIKSIEPFIIRSHENNNSKESTNTYTTGGFLIGGISGAIGGAMIDSLFEKDTSVSVSIGIKISLINDDLLQCTYGDYSLEKDHNPREILQKPLEKIRIIINKIKYN